MPKRHADPALPVEDRIVAAELAIAQVAENAAAVREILHELVVPPLPTLERALRKSLEPYSDMNLDGYELTDRDLPDLALRLLTLMAGEECLRRYAGAFAELASR